MIQTTRTESDPIQDNLYGTAGDFDIDLPLAGTPGIECRNFLDTNSGRHQIVVTFVSPVTVNGSQNPKATLTAPNGGSVDTVDVTNSVVTVNLKDVGNQQTITLTLLNVSDGTNSGNVSVPMSVLLGDVNSNKTVNNTDVALVKAQVTAPVTETNFRNDVNASGDVNNTDVAITKANVSTQLP